MLEALAFAVAVAMIAWVGIDAARRRRDWLRWSGATALFGFFGLLVWLIVRLRAPTAPEPIGIRRGISILLAAPLLFGLSIAVVTSWTTFVFQVARVEGQAMAPTLQDQDRLIVNKMVYQSRHPRVSEIVMLYYPLNPDRSFVKRIIGEEGDQIRIVRGRVFRNDIPLEELYILDGFRSHDNWGPEVVPQGYYFVLGDHRNNSSDSRHWKYVPRKYIVGRVQLRCWPIARATTF